MNYYFLIIIVCMIIFLNNCDSSNNGVDGEDSSTHEKVGNIIFRNNTTNDFLLFFDFFGHEYIELNGSINNFVSNFWFSNNSHFKRDIWGLISRRDEPSAYKPNSKTYVTKIEAYLLRDSHISLQKINPRIYDSQTNFIFKITNSVNNVATTIKSIDFPAKAEGIENRFPYIEIFIDIDDSTFTDSYWGTTNE